VFNRFACDLPGRLRTDEQSPQSLDIKMHDVSVDGARVHTRASTADLADRVLWLSLPVLCPQGLRCMVFTAVVAWRARSQVGLIFSGAPNWARRAGTANERTVPIPKIGA
jgi:hypothetical protein